jgi:hypothetical protein
MHTCLKDKEEKIQIQYNDESENLRDRKFYALNLIF